MERQPSSKHVDSDEKVCAVTASVEITVISNGKDLTNLPIIDDPNRISKADVLINTPVEADDMLGAFTLKEL